MIFLNILYRFLNALLELFSSRKTVDMDSEKLKIYVKCGPDSMVPVYLDDAWTIQNLKEAVSSELCMKPDELRIIFAGKELHDNVKLEVSVKLLKNR